MECNYEGGKQANKHVHGEGAQWDTTVPTPVRLDLYCRSSDFQIDRA